MFTPDSRYAGLATVTVLDGEGREVTVVRLRRLPATDGREVKVGAADQLDVIADQRYGDAARFWHIADANGELDARDLTRPVGRLVKIPDR
jgi:hypothetical protein